MPKGRYALGWQATVGVYNDVQMSMGQVKITDEICTVDPEGKIKEAFS